MVTNIYKISEQVKVDLVEVFITDKPMPKARVTH